jgi:aspartyl-tRNA(Asn)/glutamyl-tRNA(Gln) amidotransferase subunit A
MSEPRTLSIIEAGRQIRNKELSAMDLVCSCLEKISRRDHIVRAWVEVYAKQAMEMAQKCDEDVSVGKPIGILHGIPIGVKDIIDVKGMWTRAGCSVYPPRIAESDAPAVAQLRAAGAIILGKTETTAFANYDPAPTRNPWNIQHTPGGSSSGSGAAVADQMCLAALGTQTGGSVLRPAAYNGVVGLKPTYGEISLEGVIPVSWTLDHIGPHARQVEDVKILFNLLRNDVPDIFAHMLPRSEHGIQPPANEPFRIGFFQKFCNLEALPEIAAHVESICNTFEQAGTQIVILDLSKSFARAAAAHRVIMDTELSMYHNEHFSTLWEEYPLNIKTKIEKGLKIFGHEYVKAVHQRITFQQELSAALANVDVAIMPTAPSTAPVGLSSTGSPIFCVPWSMAGFPAITIPSGLDAQGLPLAVQIGGKPYCEETLLTIAAWCQGLLPFDFSPKEDQS